MTPANPQHHSEGGIAWIALLSGVAMGIGLGLTYTWEIDPVVERNTAPWQLSAAAQEDYIVAVALSYAHNQDLNLAFNRLLALRPDKEVWSLVAETACNRVKTGKTVTNSDIRVIRALEQLYRPQGATGCADGLYAVPATLIYNTPTPAITEAPTLTPPATKTPTPPLPTSTPQAATPTRTPSPTGTYILARLNAFCDPELDGVIEVRVYDRLGQGVPGVPVTFSWTGNQSDRAFTGLKPSRGPGFADFDMQGDYAYRVSIPDLLSEVRAVEPVPCEAVTDSGTVTTTTSYRIDFQQQAN